MLRALEGSEHRCTERQKLLLLCGAVRTLEQTEYSEQLLEYAETEADGYIWQIAANFAEPGNCAVEELAATTVHAVGCNVNLLFVWTQYSRAVPARVLSELLRCVFGDPFTVVEYRERPAWLSEDACSWSRSIYVHRTFSELPVLADRLEDAGCSDEQLLSHMRNGRVHCRGCWALDLLRGVY
jgi:hypothetical protein